MENDKPREIGDRIRVMQEVRAEYEYYAITLLATADGHTEWSTQTHWVGFADEAGTREIREPSLVNAMNMAWLWRSTGQPHVVVNSRADLFIYLLIGGNALVERALAETHFAEFMKPDPAAYSGFVGFRSLRSIPDEVLRRAPTPKLRMKVIQRDDYRCRICGRRPADYTDVELHAHHIRPWGRGGLTEDENLITLCHTCHTGLEPHETHSLFFLTGGGGLKGAIDRKQDEFFEGWRRYREKMRALMGTVVRRSPGESWEPSPENRG